MSDNVVNGKAWADFCDQLKSAGDIILADNAPVDPLIRAEGFRYLSRLTKLALEQYVEATDTDFPFFYRLSHETAKIGADNPDSAYLNAQIDGSKNYRITGKRGSMKYFSIVANAMRYDSDGTAQATGSLMDEEISWGPDGELEIIASCEEQDGNWLKLTPDANIIIVRQNSLDRVAEQAGQFRIERIDGPDSPAPIAAETLERGLATTAQFVKGVANTFADSTRMFAEYPNEFRPFDQQIYQKAGGAKDLFYAHAYWKLDPDEAWLIEVMPPECPYWNFQLNNWWMESLDYRFAQVTVNKHSARLEADGSLRIVAAARDPGIGNWIDTCGHREGTALLRWQDAQDNPMPAARVVKLEDIS